MLCSVYDCIFTYILYSAMYNWGWGVGTGVRGDRFRHCSEDHLCLAETTLTDEHLHQERGASDIPRKKASHCLASVQTLNPALSST